MYALMRKEIAGFFSTITGYVVVVVFLVLNSLFMWIIPGELNVLESGYSSLDSLFLIAPWIFLFLVPAVTMRMYSEERKTGTIELLLTRPLNDFTVVVAKYAAGILLVLISLIPTLVYFVSVWMLGSPQGNLDTGAIFGSYIGLFFLAAVYVAIGNYSSSLTDNQIVSFIISVILCFLFFYGFEALSSLKFLAGFENYIINAGINEHYKSISRGVIDSRDVLYFLGVILLFLFLTRNKLASRKWK